MAAKNLYLTIGFVDNWCELVETTQAAATTATGWTVSTGATNHSEMESGVERAASTFVNTTPPDGSLDATLGDAMRAGPFTGDFASGNWVFHFVVRAVSNGGAQDGRVRFRLFQGPNADGSGAVEITGAQQQGSLVSNISTSADFDSTLTFNPGAISLANEYLFVQVAWERTGAGGMTSADVLLRTGSSTTAGTRIVTADFSASASLTNAGAIATAFAAGSPGVAATVSLNGVASAGAIGSPTVSLSGNLTNVGAIASAEAIGTPGLTLTVGTAGIASAEAIGAPAASVVVTAGGIPGAEAFGQPTVTVPGAAHDILGAGGISSAEAFGAPTVSVFSGLQPGGKRRRPQKQQPEQAPWPYRPEFLLDINVKGAGGIPSGEAFGTPTIIAVRDRALRERELVTLSIPSPW